MPEHFVSKFYVGARQILRMNLVSWQYKCSNWVLKQKKKKRIQAFQSSWYAYLFIYPRVFQNIDAIYIQRVLSKHIEKKPKTARESDHF